MNKRSLGPCVTFFPQPTTLVVTIDAAGRPDLMTASWAGIVSKTPPTLGVSLNKTRQSYANLQETGDFTVCMAPRQLMTEADFCGLASGRDVDKFARTGLTPEPAGTVAAPLVAESPLVAECRKTGEVEIGDYRLILGEILDIRVAENACDPDGHLDPRALDPLVYLGGVREYWSLGAKAGNAYRDGKVLFREK